MSYEEKFKQAIHDLYYSVKYIRPQLKVEDADEFMKGIDYIWSNRVHERHGFDKNESSWFICNHGFDDNQFSWVVSSFTLYGNKMFFQLSSFDNVFCCELYVMNGGTTWTKGISCGTWYGPLSLLTKDFIISAAFFHEKEFPTEDQISDEEVYETLVKMGLPL